MMCVDNSSKSSKDDFKYDGNQETVTGEAEEADRSSYDSIGYV